MRIIVACEFSGIVRDAFIAAGHDAISCDLEPSEREGPHIIGDILQQDVSGYDLMIAHPPCTYLTNAGVRWMDDTRANAMVVAATFFNRVRALPVPRIAVENPIPHKYARELIGDYDFLTRPLWFGDKVSKTVCWWLKNLPPLIATSQVSVAYAVPSVHWEPPGKDRARNRSRFFPGMAAAMAVQWGLLQP